jgi:hypothetical protein
MDPFTRLTTVLEKAVISINAVNLLITLSIFTLTLVSCQRTTPNPTATNTQISKYIALPKTPTFTPTFTEPYFPTSTPLITPTNTPHPALSSKGPYLLYQEENKLIILDADGKGRKVIELPKGGYIANLQKAVSPDGKWLAFHSDDNDWFYQGGTPSGLRLNLLSLQNGTTLPITPLTSSKEDEMPPNFSYWNILALDWSPDGKKLAFAGLIDGPTIDLYIYDLNTRAIQRITNDQLNIWYMDWSPNGDLIWIENATPLENVSSKSFEVVRIDDKLIQKPKTLIDTNPWAISDFWISDSLFFLYTIPDGPGPDYLRYINVNTGITQILWKPTAEGFALDLDKKVLAVSTAEEEIHGFYIVNWNGQRTKISNDIFLDIVFRGGKDIRFLGFDGKKVTGISGNGKLLPISDKPFGSASISPDGYWYLLYQPLNYSFDNLTGMELFSETDQYVRTITDKQAEPIWRPDSKGFFFLSDSLYYVSIPDGSPERIDDCLPEDCKHTLNKDDFVWLPE